MSIPEKLGPQFNLLLEKLEARTTTFRKNADVCWRITFWLRLTGFALSAAITVLAGWHLASSDPRADVIVRNLLLLLGAASTFLASVTAFWNMERYFLENRVIFEGLKKLRDRAKYIRSRATDITEDELDALWNEFEILVTRRAEYWKQALQSVQRSDKTPSAAKSRPESP